MQTCIVLHIHFRTVYFRNRGSRNEDIIPLPKAKTSINDFTVVLIKEKSAHVLLCVKIKLETWEYSSLVGHLPRKLKALGSSSKLEARGT